jgi:hypothetical protein
LPGIRSQARRRAIFAAFDWETFAEGGEEQVFAWFNGAVLAGKPRREALGHFIDAVSRHSRQPLIWLLRSLRHVQWESATAAAVRRAFLLAALRGGHHTSIRGDVLNL